MDKTLTINGSDWRVTLQGIEGDTVENIVVDRASEKNFHATMVEDEVVVDGKTVKFRQLMLIEHSHGKEKVGDVVVQFRMNPKTKRYNVQVEKENIFGEDQTTEKIWRADRSSVDNVMQAVKKTVAHSGWIYSNARRIGGKPIKTHYVLAGWSPQLANLGMDVFDYVQSLDSPGLAAFLKALQHMPERPAHNIFKQMRSPA